MSRKDLKEKAKHVLKHHYFLLVLVCLFASVFGTAHLGATMALKGIMGYDMYRRVSRVVTEEPDNPYSDLITGDIDSAKEHADKLEEANKEETAQYGSLEIGRRAGLIATMVNSLTSGSALVSIVTFVTTAVGSKSWGYGILGSIVLLVLLFLWAFVVNVYTTISARLTLEAGVYKKSASTRVTFLFYQKKWTNTALVVGYRYLKHLLWSLTVGGWFVKRYAYLMVPYISAENPALKPKKVLALSEEMMMGHKKEAFLLDLSFLGWHLLSLVTLGLVDLFYAAPYKEATYAEYFKAIRQEALRKNPALSEVFCDKYLYELADRETLDAAYKDIEDMKAEAERDNAKDHGKDPFYSRWFGIYFRRNERERNRKNREIRDLKIKLNEKVLRGEVYPARLSPLPVAEFRRPLEVLYYSRRYSFLSIVMLFISFCTVGYVWEVFYHFISTGDLVNRGFLHGPWLPIYGVGVLLILTVLYRLRKKPLLEFFAAFTLCGVAEYVGSLLLEYFNDGARWWDYYGFFMNLDGRICLEGLLFFALGGSIAVYFLAPLIDNGVQRIKRKVLLPLAIGLLSLFFVDVIISVAKPNTGKGITEEFRTEEVGGQETVQKDIQK